MVWTETLPPDEARAERERCSRQGKSIGQAARQGGLMPRKEALVNPGLKVFTKREKTYYLLTETGL